MQMILTFFKQNILVYLHTVMTLSFWTDRSGQTVQTDQTAPRGAVWSGSSLFAIPFAPFWQNNLRFGLFVWILGSLHQKFLVSENLGTLRYVVGIYLNN